MSSWVFSRLKSGIFGSFFTSYDRTNEKFKSSVKKRKKPGSESRTKRTMARALELSPFATVTPRVEKFLLRVSVRTYGIMFLTMAVFTCFMYYIQDRVSIFRSSLQSFIVGIVIGALSLMMLFSKKSVATLILQGRLSHALLFDFLGISDEDYIAASDESVLSSPSIALLCGMILSVISYFLGPLKTVAFMAIIFLAYQALITPEAGIIIIILALPFNSYLIMSIMGLYVTLCYVIKCVIGKRVFKLEYADLWMFIMIGVMIYAGFMSFDMLSSVTNMLLIICLLSSFFVVSNLIRSKEWYKRCIIAICISSTASSAIAIAQFILGKLDITWDGFYAFSSVHERVCSTFETPDSFAVYLVACMPFLLLFLFSGKSAASRVTGLLCSAVNVTALILTYSKVGFMGAVAMLILMLLIFHRNTIYLAITVAGVVVILNFALPERILNMISSVVALPTNTHSYRTMLFDTAIEMIKARPFGTGLGETAFSSAYASLIGGTEAISDVGNLYLQIAVSCGVIGLILFIIAITVFFRLCLSYAAKTQSSLHRINALAGFCGVFGILISGFFGHVFADKSIVSVFCIVAALTFSYIKIEKEAYVTPRSTVADYLCASIDIELDRSGARDFISRRKYVRSPKRATRKAEKKKENALDGIKDNEIDPIITDD